jgi:phosphoribosylaminoimidazolecarboxamide formyltransferase/IMP cyclohydrolase
MKKRALISVSDKKGLTDFARSLTELGFEIVSTGGTFKTITEANIPAVYISEITGFPEILNGRVKTLHPFIHGGILARRDSEHLKQLDELGIKPIDLVAVNLYPFRQTIAKSGVTLEEAIENIDIGGPSMIRAAAKNYQNVIVAVNPESYDFIIEKLKSGGLDYEARLDLAEKAFTHTAEYDIFIAEYLRRQNYREGVFPSISLLSGEKVQELRYGENPHQKAAFYRIHGGGENTVAAARKLQGKELSFNNIVDLNAAFELVKEFNAPAAVIVKHTNPCGVAIGEDITEAYTKAYAADTVSAYGGIAALNREVNGDVAEKMIKNFFEAIIAPAFSESALAVFAAKPDVRLLSAGVITARENDFDLKKVSGGYLIQDCDSVLNGELNTVSRRKPAEDELEELIFAWTVVKHAKSNAIVVTKNKQTLGIGCGQMNRVGAAEIAFAQGGAECKGAVLASDAFFPFRDTVDAAARAGVKAIIHPGGSIRDKESIAAADENNIAMVFTAMRHFKH